jgi:hypothetical protein
MLTRSRAVALGTMGLALAFLITTETSADGAAAVTAWTEVVVRVYDTTGLPHAGRARAMATAGAALVTASVDVVWMDCSEMSPKCQMPPAPRELVVRLVRGRPATGTQPVPLGSALVDTGDRTGVLATVYVDRVRRLSSALGTDETVLLGRAIAHEIGHLLIGSNTHARVGLMRGHWTTEELRRDHSADWTFGAREADLIRASATFNVPTTVSPCAARRQARSLPQSPSSSCGAAGSGAGWSGRLLPR